MSEQSLIRSLRQKMGLSQAEFGAQIGLTGRSSVSELEAAGRASLPVALRLEELGRVHGVAIDAAALNEGVALSRAACLGGCDAISALHDAPDAMPEAAPSTGNIAVASRVPAVERAA